MNITIHTARIEHPFGHNDYRETDPAKLQSEIAGYVRENWENEIPDETIPEDDAAAIETYFNLVDDEFMEEDQFILDLPACRTPAAEGELPTFTFWAQDSNNTGTIYIGSLEAPDIEAAKIAAVLEVCEEWNSADQGDEPTYTPDNIHLLGIAAGDVKILHWEDICES